MRRSVAVATATMCLVGVLVTVGPAAAEGSCRVTIESTGTTFLQLQAAVDAARDGDTLLIRGVCPGETRIGTFDRGVDLTLRGAPSERTTRPSLDARGLGRPLTIRGRSRVRIVDLCITGGNAAGAPEPAMHRGGGILMWGGRVVLAGATRVIGNQALVGGGIFSTGGRLVLTGSAAVTGNALYGLPERSTGSGGGIAIRQSGTIVMKGGSLVSGNHGGRLGGGIFVGWRARLELHASASIRANRSPWRGGGVWLDDDAEVHLYDSSSIVGNHASERGGGIMNQGGRVMLEDEATVRANDATLWFGGIGNRGRLVLRGSASVRGNTALDGAGIGNDGGSVSLTGAATVARNEASSFGGGIDDDRGTVTLGDSASIRRNRAGSGAGIYDRDGTLTLDGDASIWRNRARKAGGGVFTSGGALVLHATSSITDNHAGRYGGGIYTVPDTGATVSLCSGSVAISPNDPDDPPPTLPCP